jgi:hypothetical protein
VRRFDLPGVAASRAPEGRHEGSALIPEAGSRSHRAASAMDRASGWLMHFGCGDAASRWAMRSAEPRRPSLKQSCHRTDASRSQGRGASAALVLVVCPASGRSRQPGWPGEAEGMGRERQRSRSPTSASPGITGSRLGPCMGASRQGFLLGPPIMIAGVNKLPVSYQTMLASRKSL